MTPDERAAAKARCEAAEPGPWHVFEECLGLRTILGPDNLDIIECDNNGCASDPSPDYISLEKGNAEFMAHARTDLPAALAEIDRLEARVAELDAELRRVAPFLASHRVAGYSFGPPQSR